MDDFSDRIDKMGQAIAPYAKAKAERVYIEQFRKSKKAILMRSSSGKTISDREAEAYSNDEYLQLIEGLKAAVEIEEKCKWTLEKFKLEFEFWRTTQANERYQKGRL